MTARSKSGTPTRTNFRISVARKEFMNTIHKTHPHRDTWHSGKLLFRTREVTGSNLGLEVGYHSFFENLLTSFTRILELYFSHDRFLPYPYQLTIIFILSFDAIYSYNLRNKEVAPTSKHHLLKECNERSGKALCILSLGIRRRRLVSFTLRSLYPQEIARGTLSLGH